MPGYPIHSKKLAAELLKRSKRTGAQKNYMRLKSHELANRIEGMAGLGVLSDLDGSGTLDLNGQITAEEKAQIVAALRRDP